MNLALNSQTNWRKQNRYKTFRDSCNAAPPKRSFRRHFKAILKPNYAWQPRIYKRQFTVVGKDTCLRASRLNKMAIIFMKCTKATLFSLQIKVTAQWKTRIYKPKKSRRLTARSILLFWRGGRFSDKRKMHQDDFNSWKKFIVATWNLRYDCIDIII